MLHTVYGSHATRVGLHRWLELALVLVVFAFVLLALCSPAH